MPVRVVDASAVIALVFWEPDGPDVARALAGHELHAPRLFTYELVNATAAKIRRHPGEQTASVDSLADALAMNVSLHPIDDGQALLDLALVADLSAYDAAYLALAMKLDAELVTLDAALARAARDAGLLAQ